jgi:hypothetical protein
MVPSLRASQPKPWNASLIPVRAACPAHLDLITLTILGEECPVRTSLNINHAFFNPLKAQLPLNIIKFWK